MRRYAHAHVNMRRQSGDEPSSGKGPHMCEWLGCKELAARLHVKPCTVRAWAREGRIPAVRISRRTIRFDFGEVIAALKSRWDGGRKGGQR